MNFQMKINLSQVDLYDILQLISSPFPRISTISSTFSPISSVNFLNVLQESPPLEENSLSLTYRERTITTNL